MPAKTIIAIAPPARCDRIKQLLLAHRQLELLGELSTATSLHLVARLAPDIVIVDCAAPQINPLVILPQLRAHAQQIVALSASGTAGERALLRALGATADAVLEQPGSLTEALAAAGADLQPSQEGPAGHMRGAAGLARRLPRHAQPS